MPYTRAITLSAGATPPREFQIFKPGVNDTAKGAFNFDAEAARQVMAAHAKAGAIDLPIDLEHDSLSAERRALRSDAGDARGWFQLALRPDGSLWAVNVRWTPDGARRLQERTQRFISPAFGVGEGDRPTHLINCALVAMPATHGAPALVAASKTAIVSARVAPAARAALYLLAAKRKTTISAVLLAALDTLKDAATVTPTPEAMAALKSLLAALGLKDASQPEVIDAIRGLLGAAGVAPGVTSEGEGEGEGEMIHNDPLAASPDPPPAELSGTYLAAMAPAKRQLALSRLAQLSIDGGAALSGADLAALSPVDRGRYHIERDAARRARRVAGGT